jgi:large subunit ribosomal protein L25
VGESSAIEKLGGTLLHAIESVKIRALPDHLPQSIEVPIDGLDDFETTIHVRDLTIPSDVQLLTDGDEIVARVQAPRVEEVEAPAPTETAGEGAPEAAAAEPGTAESSAAEA